MLYSGFLGFVSISSSWSTISGDSSPRPTMKRTAIMHRIWCHRNACPTIVATHMWNRPSGGAPPAALGASDSMLVVWSQASKEPGEPPRTVPGSRTCPELHAPHSGARAQAGTQHQGLGCTGPAPVRHPQPHAYTNAVPATHQHFPRKVSHAAGDVHLAKVAEVVLPLKLAQRQPHVLERAAQTNVRDTGSRESARAQSAPRLRN